MLVFLSNHKRKSAHRYIVMHASDLLMHQWDVRMYLSILPANRTPNDIEQIIETMNQTAQRRWQDG